MAHSDHFADGRENRRTFLTRGALAAGYSATALGYAVNETIHIGCIGTGGRCRELMRALGKLQGVRITAVADIWDVNLEEGRKLADPKVFATKDYTQILRRSDVDAVVIGDPDHWHSPMAIEACAAGKDVYVEKPLTHRISEGPEVVAAQNKYRRIVQVGMQQRSMPHLQKAAEIVRSGQLGKIHKVHMTWNRNQLRRGPMTFKIDASTVDWKRFLGNAPDQPFDAYRLRNWRWFWDFGGGTLTDLMVHWLDVVNWYLDLDAPATATSMGDIFHAQGLWQTPDTMQTFLHYPEKELQAYFEGTFINANLGAMTEFMGTEGTLYIDRGRYEIRPERKRGTTGEFVPNPLRASEMILGDGPRGQDFYNQPQGEVLHLSNWLECIRTRKKPNAPAEAGVIVAAAAHLGNIAFRNRAGSKMGRCEGMKKSRWFIQVLFAGAALAQHQTGQVPGQGIAEGLFRLKEMDLHLHAGMERPVELAKWIDMAVADVRRVFLLLDHIELYRKNQADYEAWRTNGGFQARYPLGPAGHAARFADFDAIARSRNDVLIFKGWEISEDELDTRLQAAPMHMADAIGWHISPRNGSAPPNGQTLLKRVRQIKELQKQFPVPMIVLHPFPMRTENLWRTAAKNGRKVESISVEEYRFFQPGEQEELIRLLQGTSIYIEMNRDTENYIDNTKCRTAYEADIHPLVNAGVQFTVASDNHHMPAANKPFDPDHFCRPLGVTESNTNAIIRELLALRARKSRAQ